ncbi:hypothetical protein BG006_003310 [Podila minutissima]|uniref:Uncharacterized protein n=1 Tax=Podila minutissima TaxID=64525 RepID=A0A9P5SMH2_9FUNG|nr:hypothetical protein BG006_003310 [Podila minutissima]
MRQTILALVALLAIVQVVLAQQVLENGNYWIYYGNYQVPKTHRFVTAEPDARAGRVRTFPRNDKSKLQVWRLKNHKNGQVTLESKGARGKYLSPGRSGALPGAYMGVTTTAQKWNVAKVRGGPFTAFELTYPKPVFNKTLVVSMDSEDKEEPYYVNLANEGVDGARMAWKFARVL